MVTLYRPPGPYTDFLEEFSDFLSTLVVQAEKILILGDFNIHMDNVNDSLTVAKACDSLGITRKHNARPTLHTYINEYQTKKALNEKTHTQVNLIKEFRNRATHHFNIEWDESFIVLNQFCQFVEWYASSHSE